MELKLRGFKRISLEQMEPLARLGRGANPGVVVTSGAHCERAVPSLHMERRGCIAPQGQKTLQSPAKGSLSSGRSGVTPERGAPWVGSLKTSGFESQLTPVRHRKSMVWDTRSKEERAGCHHFSPHHHMVGPGRAEQWPLVWRQDLLTPNPAPLCLVTVSLLE